MNTIRIVGCSNDFLPIAHMKYLKEHMGIRLKEAMAITNDVLAGKIHEISVEPAQAQQHVTALQALGAVVDVVEIVVLKQAA